MGLLDQFPHRCTIRYRSRTKGTLGGAKDTWTNEQTNVKCWEQPAGDAEIMDYEKRGMRITHKVYFTTNPSISTNHQILITERSGITVASPSPLEVRSLALPDSSAGLGVLWKVMCDQTTSEDD